MGRKKTLTPTLYKRGANGNWCFRRLINGKDKEINTGTPLEADAKKCLIDGLCRKIAVALLSASAHRIFCFINAAAFLVLLLFT